jgi:hypothetical protein
MILRLHRWAARVLGARVAICAGLALAPTLAHARFSPLSPITNTRPPTNVLFLLDSSATSAEIPGFSARAGQDCNQAVNGFGYCHGISGAATNTPSPGMCEKSLNRCGKWGSTTYTCATGDICGKLLSRAALSRQTLVRVISNMGQRLNLGLMTWGGQHADQFPYYKVTGTIAPAIRTKFMTRFELQQAGCYDVLVGPSGTCTIDGVTYTLPPGTPNSRYRVRVTVNGDDFNAHADLDHIGPNGKHLRVRAVTIAGVTKTGEYVGSYYNYTFQTGTITTSRNSVGAWNAKYYNKSYTCNCYTACQSSPLSNYGPYDPANPAQQPWPHPPNPAHVPHCTGAPTDRPCYHAQ